MTSSALPLLAASLTGALIAGVVVLAIVWKMATEYKAEQTALRGELEGRLAHLNEELVASKAHVSSLHHTLELLREEALELEERLETREEWVALRDEQLARNERKMQVARQRFAELQAERGQAQREAEGIRRRLTESQRALQVHDERSVAVIEAARGLLKIIGDEGETAPEDPMEAITQVAARIRGWFMSLSVSSQEIEAMQVENDSMRRSLSATTKAYQSYRDRTEAELDFYAQSLAGRGQRLPEDLAPEVARAVARRRASEIQLKASRAELDDLRTKLRFANRTIVALEAQLVEPGRGAVVPDMLSGLRSPSYPPK